MDNGSHEMKLIKGCNPLTSQKSFVNIYELFVIGRYFQATKSNIQSRFSASLKNTNSDLIKKMLVIEAQKRKNQNP